MSVWIAALIAVAAIAATYFACVRPMLRGRGHCATTGTARQDPEMDLQIAELREELRVLRAQDSLDSGRVTSGKPSPPTDA
ncbi:hypothetical protein [Actinokineospora sp. NPDC004072]